MVGLLRDLYESESLTDFIAEVASALVPGKYAVLAAAQEDGSTAAVDVQMQELGDTVFRTTKTAAIREHRAERAKEARREIDVLLQELAQARGNTKEKLQTTIDRVRIHLTKRIIEDADFAS